jgi:hypothetical protein
VSAVPFYLNGPANQRKLVLLWLEESYGSKEPVLPDQLTIEHVLPQTATPDWRAELDQDLDSGETVPGAFGLVGEEPNGPGGRVAEEYLRHGVMVGGDGPGAEPPGTPATSSVNCAGPSPACSMTMRVSS